MAASPAIVPMILFALFIFVQVFKKLLLLLLLLLLCISRNRKKSGA